MTDIVVVDYGMGNLRSVAKALVHVAPDRGRGRVGGSGDDPLPRSGSCCRARARCPTASAVSTQSGLRDVVLEVIRDRPFLGICLGLQMLFDESEEGPTAGPRAAPGARRAVSRRRG